MPDSGEVRLRHDELVALRLQEVGDTERLFEQLAAMNRRHPDNLVSRSWYAHYALELDSSIEQGLLAADEALSIHAEDTPPPPWNDALVSSWQRSRQSTYDALVEDRLGLLERLGVPPTSPPPSPAEFGPFDAVDRGIALYGQGASDMALAWLMYALTWGRDLPPDRAADARALAEQLAPEHRWMPDGLDRYMDARRAARSDELAQAEAWVDRVDPLVGQQMPDLKASIDGRDRYGRRCRGAMEDIR